MYLRKFCCLIFIFSNVYCIGQLPEPTAEFNFNQRHYHEKNDKIKSKAIGTKLVRDRFGNPQSSLYLEGSHFSYLNLGNSALMKNNPTSISLWVNIERRVYAGVGYEANPILHTKNAPTLDFCDAYTLLYDFLSDRIMIGVSLDSTDQVTVATIEKIQMNKWMHIVFTIDDDHVALYLNGVKQGEVKKKFRTQYYMPDSVMIGNASSTKNDRFMRGMVDDIKFFNRVLNPDEIKALYEEPNPNKAKILLETVSKYAALALSVLLISYVLVWQRRSALKKSKKRLDTEYKFHEMEIRTLKAQMNPHFIFNALNTIQELILSQENEKAQKYLSKFSKLLRSILESNTNDNLSINEEIDILTKYLDIESLRFGNSFHYEIITDEKIDQQDTYIPHMLIQPFLENAIWHGLLPKEGEKNVSIQFIFKNPENIICIIDDNGVGREKSKAKEQTFKRKSLALSYVENRLELLEQLLKIPCSVHLTDKKDEHGFSLGTCVELVLPVLKSAKNINHLTV